MPTQRLMPNQKAIPLDDALAAVTQPPSLDDALAMVQVPTSAQSSKGGLVLATARAAAPVVTRGVQELATNPNVPKVAASIGRVAGGLAPVAAGLAEGGVTAPLAGMAAAAKGAWIGGKTGWFTGKLAQNMAAPIAKAIEAVTPYLATVSTLAGAQSALDLAQMADPTRKDIGFLGIGGSTESDPTHPALLNLLGMKFNAAVKSLVAKGMPTKEAVGAVRTLREGFK